MKRKNINDARTRYVATESRLGVTEDRVGLPPRFASGGRPDECDDEQQRQVWQEAQLQGR